MSRQLPPGTLGFTFVCLLMIGSLLALTGLRQFFIEPLASTTSNVIWFAVQVAPLLVVLPGVLRLRYRAYFFTTLAATLYFVHGVLVAVDADQQALGLWEVGFSLMLVLAASYVVRLLRATHSPSDDVL